MNSNSWLIRKAILVYSLLILLGVYLQSLILFLFRLKWGLDYVDTGWGKFNGHANVVEFFTSLGIPYPDLNAWFVAGVECFGGFLLLIGFASRPIALVLTVNMLVAYLSVDEDRTKLLRMFSDPEPFIAADPFFFLVTAALVFAFGPGAISVDALLKKILCKKIDGNIVRSKPCCP